MNMRFLYDVLIYVNSLYDYASHTTAIVRICNLWLTTCALCACDMLIWYVCTNLSDILARHCAGTCRGMNMQVVLGDFCAWCVYLGVTRRLRHRLRYLYAGCTVFHIHCVLWLTVLRWYIRSGTEHAYKQVTQSRVEARVSKMQCSMTIYCESISHTSNHIYTSRTFIWKWSCRYPPSVFQVIVKTISCWAKIVGNFKLWSTYTFQIPAPISSLDSLVLFQPI